MRKLLVFSICVATALSIGCTSSKKKFQSQMKEAKAWFSVKAGRPGVNISGTWEDPQFGSWGTPMFVQKGNRVTGTMGWYSVQGVASGRKVYLIATSGDWLYFTLILEVADKKTLIGKYTEGLNKNEDFGGSVFTLNKK